MILRQRGCANSCAGKNTETFARLPSLFCACVWVYAFFLVCKLISVDTICFLFFSRVFYILLKLVFFVKVDFYQNHQSSFLIDRCIGFHKSLTRKVSALLI